MASLFLCLLHPQRASAADHIELKYELYQEDDGRIEVKTSTFEGEARLTSSTVVKGSFVYDSISGATPTGGPPRAGSSQVPLAVLEEYRYAGSAELIQQWGRQTLTPQFSYSTESDYDSVGVSLTDAIDFNNKNTILSLGAAHTFDTIFAANSPYLPSTDVNHKDTTDLFIGVSQLLSPKTILTLNGTYGYSTGYLTDPYKGVRFDSFPDVDGTFIFGENRPRHKSREIFLASLTQYVTPANASVELAYRFYHDSFGISAHTASLTWYQKIGRHVTLEPFVRYYDQTEASFYFHRVEASLGNPIPIFSTPNTPRHYSADYRLSALHTWTYGLKATCKLTEHFWVDAAYKRYEMHGHDHVTAQSAYPQANIFTFGLLIWF